MCKLSLAGQKYLQSAIQGALAYGITHPTVNLYFFI
jgi:hypothetical protein